MHSLDRAAIISVYGKDYMQMTVRLLEKAGLAALIGNRDARICLKPNLVVAGRAENGGVTHPEVVDGVISYLGSNGFENLVVLEGSWVGDDTDRAFRVSGIGDVCRRHGVPYFNTQKDSYRKLSADGHSFNVTERLFDHDWIINMPVLKGHCQTLVTCALKNHKGLLSNPEKRRFHSEGLHAPIAYLAKAVTQTFHEFIVVDNICGDLDFEEGGNPVYNGRVFCCADPVAYDSYVCRFMGYDAKDVPYIGLAEKIGVGSSNLDEVEFIDMSEDGLASSHDKVKESSLPAGKAQDLAAHVDSRNSCSACYGSLISALYRMDKEGLLGRLLGQLDDKIRIGQGYRGEEIGAIGVGSCTRGCARSLEGCPPAASDIYEYLKAEIKRK